MNHPNRRGPWKRLLEGAQALSPNCREASRLQSRALDGPLSLVERVGLRIHLILCKWCARYGRQIRLLREAARQGPERPGACSQTGLSPEAQERLRSAIRNSRPKD